jgi:hypothetical protein
MDTREVERSRAALGLAVLVGAFATLLAGGLLAPHTLRRLRRHGLRRLMDR